MYGRGSVESGWIPFYVESVARSRPIAVENRVRIAGDVGGYPHCHRMSGEVERFLNLGLRSPHPGRDHDNETVVSPPTIYTTEEAVHLAKGPTTCAPSRLPWQQAPAVGTLVAMPAYDKEAYIAKAIVDAQQHVDAALVVDDGTKDDTVWIAGGFVVVEFISDFRVLSRRVIEPTIIGRMLEDYGNAIDDNRIHPTFIHIADEAEVGG